jgi:hypothetical protein
VSGPHGFAVRNQRRSSCAPCIAHGSKIRPAITLRADAAASTASHPAFVTMANAPLAGKGRGELVELICPTAKAKHFFKQDWTTQISLKSLR